jgi:hypothetical protein
MQTKVLYSQISHILYFVIEPENSVLRNFLCLIFTYFLTLYKCYILFCIKNDFNVQKNPLQFICSAQLNWTFTWGKYWQRFHANYLRRYFTLNSAPSSLEGSSCRINSKILYFAQNYTTILQHPTQS